MLVQTHVCGWFLSAVLRCRAVPKRATQSWETTSSKEEDHGQVLYMPRSSRNHVIISLFKSLTTMYLPIAIHPHLNHLIWLLCALTIALCPLLHCPKSLTNNRLGASSFRFLFAIPAALQPPIIMVPGASKALMYFRRMLVVVRVYKSTGHFQPDFPAIREDSQCRAPWYREMWFGWDDTP